MYQIKETVFEKIRKSLRFPEMGGILGTSDGFFVDNFYHDKTGITKGNQYIPDVDFLNKVVDSWYKSGIQFIGFVHTHRKFAYNLSGTDIIYAKEIKKSCEMSEILMLLYIPDENSFFEYVV